MDLETRIEDLQFKSNILDSNKIIIEDDEDTKQSTVSELKKSFNGDLLLPSSSKYYTSEKINSIKTELETSIDDKAKKSDLENVKNKLTDIVTLNPNGEKDNEIIEARDGEDSLDIRLVRDNNIINETMLPILTKQSTVSGIESITIKNPKSKSIGNISILIDYIDPALTGSVTITSNESIISTRNITYPKSLIELKIDGEDVTIECSISNSTIEVTYDAYIIDTKYLDDRISYLYDHVHDKRDKCSLIDDYGEYYYFDDLFSSEPDSSDYLYNEEYNRNGKDSLEIAIRKAAITNPFIIKEIDKPIIFSTLTLNYFIDKSVLESFDSNDAFEITLCSDLPSVVPSNYYSYKITSSEMINGWNHLRKHIDDFTVTGTPDSRNLKFIRIRVLRNDSLNGKSIFFNSFVFNQSMKPKLLMCFNGTYNKGFEYTYPYLYARGIPFTLFINEGTTLSNDNKLLLMNLIHFYNCEVSTYGAHPYKEKLNQTDNPYEQYQMLKLSKKYIQDLFCDNPVSFSVPFGNLQNLTIPLLKDLGYKILRVETSKPTYSAFYSEDDLSIPVIKINNKVDADTIKDQIDYAIKTGQTISLFTNNITEYGDESNAKQMVFETIIDYIVEKVNNGDIECMSYRDFYNKCVK